jgi:hypothetical protein
MQWGGNRNAGGAILACALWLVGCGGSAVETAAPPCEGITLRGACWTGSPGITLSTERVARVVERAEEYWGHPKGSLNGWRIQFTHGHIVVDGQPFAGYTWPRTRQILAAPFAPDCFERSAIFHELGHAWGFEEDDPRMSGEGELIRTAMSQSGWPGCAGDPDDDDDHDHGHDD